MIANQLNVNLGPRSYTIYIGRGMLSSLAPTLQQRGLNGHIVLITDNTVASLYLKPAERHLRHFGFDVLTILVPPGERQKSLARAGNIFTAMLKAGIDRNSVVVAFGGGVIGDLAGFVAATYQRGIALVQVPTTLLSQVDSSVGGKVAVNHPLGKNMIGAFYQPALVWADAEMLVTLPYREIICGVGEIVKYGIALDSDFFSYLESNLEMILKLEPSALLHVQNRSLELKSHIVAEDEKETGIRSVLNLGHTVGHALEAAGNYRLLKHGEAVLLGTIAESFIANKLGVISDEDYRRIVEFIGRIPLKAGIENLETPDILRVMKHDKKSIGKGVRFVLPCRIGGTATVDRVDAKLVAESLQHIRKLKH
jgi:3-dehydroquinate synthase